MTNKYSGLSDFEINVEVFNKINPNHHYSMSNYPTDSSLCIWHGDGTNGYDEIIDYCNHTELAFQLMIDNKFELGFNSLMNKWAATFLSNNTFIMSCNENPCRAIAETFLLMKDAEKE